ncbi:hypothetical protein A9Q99_10200 [Gammaproteobacteria bacterium 45_16_T64]|nr:hypothetical protein A9Q99_10200 [Gammaproteobacteria bacterium 45_16_T64]
MSKVWREIADPKKHVDFMSTRNEGGIPIVASRDNLIEKWVYFANVCDFTFQFSSLDQVVECKEYFSNSVHPSTKERGHDLEHYWHPWYAKLPKGINKGSKREKVIKSLNEIIGKWGSPQQG